MITQAARIDIYDPLSHVSFVTIYSCVVQHRSKFTIERCINEGRVHRLQSEIGGNIFNRYLGATNRQTPIFRNSGFSTFLIYELSPVLC